MPILAGLVFLIEFSFIFHALKTGRPRWWIFIIMGFPVMGCLIYYFVEVFPGTREHRKAQKAARKLVKAWQPDAELKRRVEELEVCGSVDNKIALAKECVAHGMPDDAVRLYESCLQGAFSNDANITYLLAQAAVEAAAWDKAESAIARLKINHPNMRPLDVRLLEARILEGRGNTDGALAAYRALTPEFIGLEARYRHGALLSRLGQHEAANALFNELLKQAKRTGTVIEEEEQWVDLSRRAIVGK